jgi:hypothetical protein
MKKALLFVTLIVSAALVYTQETIISRILDFTGELPQLVNPVSGFPAGYRSRAKFLTYRYSGVRRHRTG